MYVTLARGEIRQNFNIWVYGEREKIVRGSGLFVPETGTSLNHHFLTPMDEDTFNFKEGTYKIEVFTNVLGNKEKSLLFSQELFITQSHAEELKDKNSGIYFDWSPATRSYFAHSERRPPSPDAENFLRFLSEMRNPEKSASSDVP